MTTPLMEEALARIGSLPAARQDALAALRLEELASEDRRDEQFAGSQDMLAALAEEALQGDRRGETEPLEGLLK